MAVLRILAVDDEILALRRIELLLLEFPNVALVGTARTGEGALNEIRRLKPDVVLLDIQMTGMDGFDVLEALDGPRPPRVVFVTAFDAFAARAFDLSATDYVVKPVQRERLHLALERARRAIEASDSALHISELRAVVARLRAAQGPEAPAAAIWAERRGELARVPVAHIDWIEAEGDYVRLHARGQRYLMRNTLSALAAELDPKAFLRVRRSALVRLDRVESMRRERERDLRVRLVTGDEIRVGRTYVKGVRATLLHDESGPQFG